MRPAKPLLLLFGVSAAAIFAQTNQTSLSIPPLTSQYSPGSNGGVFLDLNLRYGVVRGAPFRGEINARRIKEEPDGKQAVYESHEIIARDIEGRLYHDHPASPVTKDPEGIGMGNTFHTTRIFDPVAMTEMDWRDDLSFPFGLAGITDSSHQTIRRTRLDPGVVLQTEPPQFDACDDPAIHSYSRSGTEQIEQLGERTIQGLAVRGCRVTASIPANPSLKWTPDTIVQESRLSPDLRMVLLRTRHDPGVKEDEVVELDNIKRGAPDPNLFVPPPDYTVRDVEQERQQAQREETELPQPSRPAEELAGAWEAADPILGQGVELGIFLKMDVRTDLQLQGTRVISEGPERIMTLQVRVSQRTAGNEQEFTWLSAVPSIPPGRSSFDGRRLHLAYPGGPPPAIKDSLALDLSFNEKDPSWVGTYTRNGISKQIRLERPGASSATSSNPFVGTWSTGGLCIRISRGADGTLVAWRNSTSGTSLRFLPGCSRPPCPTSPEGSRTKLEGQPLKVQINGNSVKLEDAYVGGGVAGGIALPLLGTLSADGTQIAFVFVPPSTAPQAPGGANVRPGPVYSKIAGEDCFTGKP
jgi:hypothetical protein